jgi:signal transduction histidine kinase
MRRVIENLVSNAMKHTAMQSKVRVILSGSKDRVFMGVHDDGPGIRAERRERIFEPFNSEGVTTAEGYESSGLGLAFCRLAVEAQGGTIRVDDANPRGCAFIVEMPRG